MNAQTEVATTAVEEASREFLTAWTRLVSTTNWEKGRIIAEWRRTLLEAGAPTAEYSDEAWSRRVGGVSSQHVGRLRRVHERFDAARDSYPKLFWSHFQVALEWNDAEMWLEGAVINGWSIAEMRRQRAEVTGLAVDSPDDATASCDDEDLDDANSELAATLTPEIPGVRDRLDASAPFDDADDESDGEERDDERAAFEEEWNAAATDDEAASPVRPFAALPDLPDDLAEACESFKLAIIRHKVAGWTEIARDDVLRTLDALKELTLAPAE